MLIEDPFRVEKQTHKALQDFRERKEWFRCSCEEAIVAIQRVAGSEIISEAFKRADREQAEKKRKDQEKAEIRQKLVNSQIGFQEMDVRSKYDTILASRLPIYPLWQYWIACAIGGYIILTILFTKISDISAILFSWIGGLIAAGIVKQLVESTRQESTDYKAIIQERQGKLEEARTAITCLVLLQPVKESLGSKSISYWIRMPEYGPVPCAKSALIHSRLSFSKYSHFNNQIEFLTGSTAQLASLDLAPSLFPFPS